MQLVSETDTERKYDEKALLFSKGNVILKLNCIDCQLNLTINKLSLILLLFIVENYWLC